MHRLSHHSHTPHRHDSHQPIIITVLGGFRVTVDGVRDRPLAGGPGAAPRPSSRSSPSPPVTVCTASR